MSFWQPGPDVEKLTVQSLRATSLLPAAKLSAGQYITMIQREHVGEYGARVESSLKALRKADGWRLLRGQIERRTEDENDYLMREEGRKRRQQTAPVTEFVGLAGKGS